MAVVHENAAEQRRQLRQELNRRLILDAAEEVFAANGFAGASVREIARLAGFSTAGLYLFFQNKDDLYLQTLLRRGTELVALMVAVAERDEPPRQRLHDMTTTALEFYQRWPHYAQLLAQLQHGYSLRVWEEHPAEQVRNAFEQAMEVEARVIREGQERGEIRAGDPMALAHLFSVMVTAHLVVGAERGHSVGEGGGLTVEELQDLVDAAFRMPDRA